MIRDMVISFCLMLALIVFIVAVLYFLISAGITPPPLRLGHIIGIFGAGIATLFIFGYAG